MTMIEPSKDGTVKDDRVTLGEREQVAPTGNPFKNIISVEFPYVPESTQAGYYNFEGFDGMSLETAYKPGDIVGVTIRVPEQFFTETYNRADWEEALRGDERGFHVGDLTEVWRNNLDPAVEIYGPDGQQVPLW